MDTAPSPPPPAPAPTIAAMPAASLAARSTRSQHYNPEENTITNICTSNIILDLPQVTTRSRTGAIKPQPPPATTPLNPPTVTKIIIKQTQLPSGGVSVTATTASSPRQPPPLQQMQSTPPPPRLQQMVHAQAPPPLQAKPRGAATAPPPLQIKVVPSARQSDSGAPIIVTSSGETKSVSSSGLTVEVGQSGDMMTGGEEVAEEGVSSATHTHTVYFVSLVCKLKQLFVFLVSQMEVEVNVASVPSVAPAASRSICVRAGCTNPAVDSKDWDKEYCSNECVATHCRCVCTSQSFINVTFSHDCKLSLPARSTFFWKLQLPCYLLFSVL